MVGRLGQRPGTLPGRPTRLPGWPAVRTGWLLVRRPRCLSGDAGVPVGNNHRACVSPAATRLGGEPDWKADESHLVPP